MIIYCQPDIKNGDVPRFFNRRLNLKHIRRFALCIQKYTYTNHTYYVLNCLDTPSSTGCRTVHSHYCTCSVHLHIRFLRQHPRSSGMSSYPGTTVTDRTFPICCLYTYHFERQFCRHWSVLGNWSHHYQTPHTHRSAPHYGTHHA